jgi:hypothetical protein
MLLVFVGHHAFSLFEARSKHQISSRPVLGLSRKCEGAHRS